MRGLLGALAIYGLIHLVVLGIGFATGWLISWLMPSLDFGIALLIGVVASGFSIGFFSRIATFPLPDDEPMTETASRPPIVIIEPPFERRRNRRR